VRITSHWLWATDFSGLHAGYKAYEMEASTLTTLLWSTAPFIFYSSIRGLDVACKLKLL